MLMLKRAMVLIKPITIQKCFRQGKLVAQASQADFAKDIDIKEEMGQRMKNLSYL